MKVVKISLFLAAYEFRCSFSFKIWGKHWGKIKIYIFELHNRALHFIHLFCRIISKVIDSLSIPSSKPLL